MMTAFHNLLYYYADQWSWSDPTPTFAHIGMGFILFAALNIVAIIGARFADILHSILQKG